MLDADTADRLRSHLGRARGAVGAARRRGDDAGIRQASARVQAAKEGLGERGTPWWDLSETHRHERAADRLGRLDRGDHEAEQRPR